MHGMLGSCASGVRASSLFNRVHTRRSPQQILASLTRSRTHTAIPASGSVTMSAPSIIAESDITSTTARNSSAESSGFPSPRSTHTSQSDTPLIRQTAPQNNAQTSAENSSPGWPYVAGYMATTPEFQTFSRFRELNVKNLLYYQVEITQLSEKLQKQELRDWKKKGMSGVEKYAKFAEELFLSKDTQDNKQWRLIVDIRERLKEYSKLYTCGWMGQR
jgi:hypothetical protein